VKNSAAQRSTRFTDTDRTNATKQSGRKVVSLRLRAESTSAEGGPHATSASSVRLPPASDVPSPVPTVEPRLRIVNGDFVELGGSTKLSATPLPLRAKPQEAWTRAQDYDRSAEIECPKCSPPDVAYCHLPFPRLSRREAQIFLGFTENTLFTKHSRGEMPTAISGPPLEFDTCHLAAFKYDGVILGHAQYDRSAHLAAIPAARAERERKRQEKSAKLSAHMRRRHAAARKAATRLPVASRPSSTRRAIKAGGAR
jgi:hypothetical protein